MTDITGENPQVEFSNSLRSVDHSIGIAEQIEAMFHASAPGSKVKPQLSIGGNGSRSEWIPGSCAPSLALGSHRGILDYQPDELTLRVRAGTPLSELESLLAENRQCFAAEIPQPQAASSIGGAIACGWDGPGRAFGLSLRDITLGCRFVNGRGEIVNFGGQVMKNVAGYDLARLQVGALGTLGAILDITLRLQPRPECQMALRFPVRWSELPDWWQRSRRLRPLISATCYVDGFLHLRLSGRASAIEVTASELGGESSDLDWNALKNLQLPFFSSATLACVYLPRFAEMPISEGECLVEWEGARIWVRGGNHQQLATQAAARGGYVRVLRGESIAVHVTAPKWHRRVRAALDPCGLFNTALFHQHFCPEATTPCKSI